MMKELYDFSKFGTAWDNFKIRLWCDGPSALRARHPTHTPQLEALVFLEFLCWAAILENLSFLQYNNIKVIINNNTTFPSKHQNRYRYKYWMDGLDFLSTWRVFFFLFNPFNFIVWLINRLLLLHSSLSLVNYDFKTRTCFEWCTDYFLFYSRWWWYR